MIAGAMACRVANGDLPLSGKVVAAPELRQAEKLVLFHVMETVMIRIKSLLPAVSRRLLVIVDDQRLTEAAALLSDGIRHMAVVCDRDGVMVGVVTRTDIVRQIQHCDGCACTTACNMVMSRGSDLLHAGRLAARGLVGDEGKEAAMRSGGGRGTQADRPFIRRRCSGGAAVAG